MSSQERFLLTQTRYPAWVYQKLLTEDQCRQYRQVIDNLASKKDKKYFQNIIRIPKLAEEVWQIIRNDLPQKLTRNGKSYKLVGLSDHITVSRHQGKHIGIHKDEDVRIAIQGDRYDNLYCFYKLAIYLNDCSDPSNRQDRTGGTCFYDGSKRLLYTTKPALGAGLMFDMREWHSGADIGDKIKYMLGFRPVYKLDHSNHQSKGKKKWCSKCQRYH